jgi:hypothetical protein
MQPRGAADLLQQANGALFKDPGANPRQYVVAVLALEDDRINAVNVEQLAEQQARGP